LHAKSFELVCRKGRIVVAGSPNASRAGLYGANVEVALVRIERNATVGWAFRDALPPPANTSQGVEDLEAEALQGVLRAALDEERVSGFVLTPKIEGQAILTCYIDAARPTIQEVVVAHDGSFVGKLTNLEALTWHGGRIVARIEQGAKVAEGFVSSLAARQLYKRAGPIAQRLLAMLSGTETPTDVAAIMTWFKEDLGRLPRAEYRAGGGGARSAVGGPDVFVPLSEMSSPQAIQSSSPSTPPDPGEDSWQRTLHSLVAAFKRTPGPWPDAPGQDNSDDEGETERQREARVTANERGKRQNIDRASELFSAMLNPTHDGRHVTMALQIAHYVLDTSQPGEVIARNWLDAIIDSSVADNFVEEPALIALSLLRFGSTKMPNARNARRFLLSKDIDPASELSGVESYPMFAELLAPGFEYEAFMVEVRAARVAGEEVRAFLAAASAGVPGEGYEGLKSSPCWPTLARAFIDSTQLERWHIVDHLPTGCPKCRTAFTPAASQDLRVFGVTECHSLTLTRAI
jgi:hypothetical protein